MKNKTKSFLFMAFVSAACLFISGCSGSKELENGVYYLESDKSAYLTVTDVKEESDSEGKYYKTCKIQFSDTYNVDKWQSYLVDTLTAQHAFDGGAIGGEAVGKNLEYYTELYKNTIDLKKQLVDKPCVFYVYDIVDEEYDTVYTRIEGIDDDYCIEITFDTDGSLVVDSELSSRRDIFRR